MRVCVYMCPCVRVCVCVCVCVCVHARVGGTDGQQGDVQPWGQDERHKEGQAAAPLGCREASEALGGLWGCAPAGRWRVRAERPHQIVWQATAVSPWLSGLGL